MGAANTQPADLSPRPADVRDWVAEQGMGPTGSGPIPHAMRAADDHAHAPVVADGNLLDFRADQSSRA